MKLTILGSGCPSVDSDRYGPSALIDCGSGVTQRLLEHGVQGSEIDALLLTHLHSDHIVDLFQLIISSWHQGRSKPQKIFGPPGTKKYVDQMMNLWRSELEQRIAHEQRPSTKALEIEISEINNGTLMNFKKLSVMSVEVLHQPVKKAFGFIFETPQEKAVIVETPSIVQH